MATAQPLVFVPDPERPLAEIDPGYTADYDKESARARLAVLGRELDDMQDYLYASRQHAVLVVLQGTDTSGKDGTIRDVFGHLDPLGCRVQAFKAPSEVELAHDFLWRIHQVVPERGFIGLFNRSHYEDVLAVRVRNLAPREVWERRYDHINHFERLLTDSGTLVVKFFLHISKDEQKARLQARAENTEKAWKIAPSDYEDRKLWDEYQQAYQEALVRCHSAAAPWYIVPANKKWFRNLAVATVMHELFRNHVEGWRSQLEARGREGLATLKRLGLA